MSNPIYVPKGAAKEYGDFALNIYTGCPHACYYCFAPNVLRRDREIFHTDVRPRDDIVSMVKNQLHFHQIKGKTIHLCFTCDPYPRGYDTSVTRTIIEAIKNSGNHVQILTKSDEIRDLNLLDENDWYGVSYAGYSDGVLYPSTSEPYAAAPIDRLIALEHAHNSGVKTWVSMEPVLDAGDVLHLLDSAPSYIDRYKIGKLNYHPSSIDWKAFGLEAERICKEKGLDYYIKDALRKEMEKVTV